MNMSSALACLFIGLALAGCTHVSRSASSQGEIVFPSTSIEELQLQRRGFSRGGACLVGQQRCSERYPAPPMPCHVQEDCDPRGAKLIHTI